MDYTSCNLWKHIKLFCSCRILNGLICLFNCHHPQIFSLLFQQCFNNQHVIATSFSVSGFGGVRSGPSGAAPIALPGLHNVAAAAAARAAAFNNSSSSSAGNQQQQLSNSGSSGGGNYSPGKTLKALGNLRVKDRWFVPDSSSQPKFNKFLK